MQGRLILVGDVPNMKELAEVLGCKVGVLPNTYLGLPLGAPYKSLYSLGRGGRAFQKRFALWKR